MNRRVVSVVGIVSVTLLAGCASERWIYERPGLTPAKLDQDLGLPARGAPAVLVRRLALGRVDRDLNRCMSRKVRRPPRRVIARRRRRCFSFRH
jgi:hypothetical protein